MYLIAKSLSHFTTTWHACMILWGGNAYVFLFVFVFWWYYSEIVLHVMVTYFFGPGNFFLICAWLEYIFLSHDVQVCYIVWSEIWFLGRFVSVHIFLGLHKFLSSRFVITLMIFHLKLALNSVNIVCSHVISLSLCLPFFSFGVSLWLHTSEFVSYLWYCFLPTMQLTLIYSLLWVRFGWWLCFKVIFPFHQVSW